MKGLRECIVEALDTLNTCNAMANEYLDADPATSPARAFQVKAQVRTIISRAKTLLLEHQGATNSSLRQALGCLRSLTIALEQALEAAPGTSVHEQTRNEVQVQRGRVNPTIASVHREWPTMHAEQIQAQARSFK